MRTVCRSDAKRPRTPLSLSSRGRSPSLSSPASSQFAPPSCVTGEASSSLDRVDEPRRRPPMWQVSVAPSARPCRDSPPCPVQRKHVCSYPRADYSVTGATYACHTPAPRRRARYHTLRAELVPPGGAVGSSRPHASSRGTPGTRRLGTPPLPMAACRAAVCLCPGRWARGFSPRRCSVGASRVSQPRSPSSPETRSTWVCASVPRAP